jgi:4-amino-4-deoxy-L-arabinose transferase-like glycosyltransferase
LSTETRRAIFVFALLALLYLYGLAKCGMLGPDEPRYAAIGREMAHSGDWVTPRLWGEPWFEKPPLLYWMTAAATKAGLDPDRAPRLPVALTAVVFLVFFFWFVNREFGAGEALYSTSILATSAGWLAYSIVAVTDVPMSATFFASLLLALLLTREQRHATPIAALCGALLGLSVLAKGLVPLVLFAPVAVLLRHRWRHLAIIAAACIVFAGPWYALVTLRNGRAFIDEFIWKHHFQRFGSDALKHVRPFWFYIPVLLAGLLPWTPLLALARPRLLDDHRLKFLAFWTAFALLFFSASRNKLPGYVLPLLPAIALLMGIGLARARRSRIPLALAALLIGIIPLGVSVLPQALNVGLSRSSLPAVQWMWLAAGVVVCGVAMFLETQSRRSDAVLFVAFALGIVLFRSRMDVMPMLDRTVSVRPFFRQHGAWLEGVCLHEVSRDAAYGLQYYAGRAFPVCEDSGKSPKIMQVGDRLILLD